MSKSKTLVAAVVVLILLNVSLLIFGSLRPPHHPSGTNDGVKHTIAKKLNFDTDQIARYEQIIVIHQQKIKEQEELIKVAKNELYRNLRNDDQTIKESTLRKIGLLQTNIEQIHYDHFIEIKNLCKEEQLAFFNELQTELGRLFSKPPPKKK